MSQNSAIPAFRITSRLSTAAIPVPARMPSSMEWTRCETYPVAIPATNPFSKENVITLPMTWARYGSRNPLKPSRSPRAPPTASPSTGFVRLIADSHESAIAPAPLLLRTLVGLHHAEEIPFRVFAVRKVTDARNRSFGHHQFSPCVRRRLDSCIDGFHTNRVGGGLNIGVPHQAAIDPRRCLRTVTLRRVTHNHSHDAAGQNDFEIIAVLHIRHDICEDESHGQAE